MELQDFFLLLKRKAQTIFIIVATVILLTVSISLLMPLRYEVKSKLLITQNSANTDAYSLSKSNEYLGNLFAQVIQSSSFLDLALTSSYNINQDYFELENAKKMQTWKKTVSAKSHKDSGIIEISVFHKSPYQAQQIALAVNDVLLNRNQNYHGSGDKIRINIIDQPLTSKYPVKPNIITNVVIAFILSFFFALFYVYLLPEKKHDLYIFRSKKNKKQIYQQELSKENIWNNLPVQSNDKNNKVAELKISEINELNGERGKNQDVIGNINNILK